MVGLFEKCNTRDGAKNIFCRADLGLSGSEKADMPNYRDYYLFKLYKAFANTTGNEGLIRYLKTTAAKVKDEMEIDSLLDELKKCQDKYIEIISMLNDDYDNEIYEKEIKLSFYRELLALIDAEIKNYSDD